MAVIAVITSFFYNRLLQWFSIKSLAIATIILFSLFFLILGYVIHFEIIDPWILYFYYLSLSIFGVMVTSQFWIIANLAFDVREAKRLFGFIGAGAIAGGVFGGYLTSILTNYFGSGFAMIVAVFFLLCCLPLILMIWRIREKRFNKFVETRSQQNKKDLSGSSLKLVLSSKHLLNLAALTGVSVFVAKLIDYQFSDFSHEAYEDPHDLAAFFGFWFSTFNVIAILIQLFLTNRLLAYFGVATNLIFWPLVISPFITLK